MRWGLRKGGREGRGLRGEVGGGGADGMWGNVEGMRRRRVGTWLWECYNDREERREKVETTCKGIRNHSQAMPKF